MRTICKLLLPMLVATVAVACDKATKLRHDTPPEESLHSIGWLKTLCPTNGSVAVTQEITIRGTVTANDHYGEFSKEIAIEDASGAIRIAVDYHPLSDLFPFGCIVTVQCNGLALGDYGGRIVLGNTPDRQYGTTRIPASEIERRIRREGYDETLRPARLGIEEIADEHIDSYIRLDDVRFAEEGPWCEPDPETHRPVTTEREIVDVAGRRFVVRTLGSCLYAEEPVPSGTGSLYGIVDYFNGRYSLRITAHRILFPTAATPPTTCP